jgi:hypothetical protein
MKNLRHGRAALAVAASLIALPSSAHAGLRDVVMAAAARCWTLGNDKAWLDCYYRAAQPMQAAINPLTPPARARAVPAPRTAVAAPPPPRRGRSWLGRMFNDDKPRAPERVAAIPGAPPAAVDHVTARLTDYSVSDRGIVTVTLDNGEVWRQIDGDGPPPRLNRPARTYVVTIRPGFLGAFNLTVGGQAGLYRVRRLN